MRGRAWERGWYNIYNGIQRVIPFAEDNMSHILCKTVCYFSPMQLDIQRYKIQRAIWYGLQIEYIYHPLFLSK